MERLAEIKELLHKHRYLTYVSGTENKEGCVVSFPQAKLIKPHMPKLLSAYHIVRGEKSGVQSAHNISPGEMFVSVPEYAVRAYILMDIKQCTDLIPISRSLLYFQDATGQPLANFSEVMAPPADSVDAGRDGFLIGMVEGIARDGFSQQYEDVAASHGVIEGYRLLQTNFDKRSI